MLYKPKITNITCNITKIHIYENSDRKKLTHLFFLDIVNKRTLKSDHNVDKKYINY